MSEAKETFYALDLDRTLLNTDKNAGIFDEIVAQYSLHTAVRLQKALETYAAKGESLSMRDYIRMELDDETVRRIERDYEQAVSHQDVLNPGARKLIDLLSRMPHTSYGIMTYGSLEGQLSKIRASGLETIPHIVIEQKNKGDVIASWQNPDQTFTLPSELSPENLIVSHVGLVDDKGVSFTGLPSNGAKGYLLQTSAGDQKELANVTIVRDLDEFRELIDKA